MKEIIAGNYAGEKSTRMDKLVVRFKSSGLHYPQPPNKSVARLPIADLEKASLYYRADALRDVVTEFGAVMRHYGGVWCKDNTLLELTIKVRNVKRGYVALHQMC